METMVERLFDTLGLDEPEDEPFILIDNEIHIYFNESEFALEMCSPFMIFPDNMSTLQHVLRLNYTSPVIIGSDADNTALVAVYRLPKTSTEQEVLAGLELFISSVKQFKESACSF